MREIRTSGSEGGGVELNRASLPLSEQAPVTRPGFPLSRERRFQLHRINVRIRRLSLGNPGDVRPAGAGVSELRIDYWTRIPHLLHTKILSVHSAQEK